MRQLKQASGWLAAMSATVLFAVTVLALVDGLEWALLSMLGVGLLPMEIIIGLTTLPLLYAIWIFGRSAVRAERENAAL